MHEFTFSIFDKITENYNYNQLKINPDFLEFTSARAGTMSLDKNKESQTSRSRLKTTDDNSDKLSSWDESLKGLSQTFCKVFKKFFQVCSNSEDQ